MSAERRIRVLLGKLGLDAHDRGVKVLTTMLRDAGMEVIYAGVHRTPEQMVSTAIQEDVDIIGLSFLSEEHLFYTSKVASLLKENGCENVLLLVGGTIPVRDVPKLRQIGASEVFRGDSPVAEIINYVRKNFRERR